MLPLLFPNCITLNKSPTKQILLILTYQLCIRRNWKGLANYSWHVISCKTHPVLEYLPFVPPDPFPKLFHPSLSLRRLIYGSHSQEAGNKCGLEGRRKNKIVTSFLWGYHELLYFTTIPIVLEPELSKNKNKTKQQQKKVSSLGLFILKL
jgi:hypothetical protein